MLKTELLEIIANGENSGVEFKRDDIRPEQPLPLSTGQHQNPSLGLCFIYATSFERRLCFYIPFFYGF